MAFPLTGASLTANGTTVAVPGERAISSTRTAGMDTTYPRSGIVNSAWLLLTSLKAIGTVTQNGGITFPRSSNGTTTLALDNWFVRASVSRTAATTVTFDRTADGVRRFLLLETRRPNDASGRIKGVTSLAASMRINRGHSGTFAGSTTLSARLAYWRELSGTSTGSTTVTAGLAYLRQLSSAITGSTTLSANLVLPASNDDYYHPKRIWAGGDLVQNNAGATLQHAPYGGIYDRDYYLGGSASLWYYWKFPPDGSEATFNVASTDFKPMIWALTVYDYFNTGALPELWEYFPVRGLYWDTLDTDQARVTFGWNPGYIGVLIRIASLDGGTGNFTLSYPAGTAPDGSYTPIPIELAANLHLNTRLDSRRASGSPPVLNDITAYGQVNLSVFGEGELAIPDIPGLIACGTSLGGVITVDTPKVLDIDGISTVSMPKVRPVVSVQSAAGTGVRNRNSGGTTSSSESTDELISPLSPYYI